MTLTKLLLCLWLAAAVFAPSAPKFEVATIKLADPNASVRNQMIRVGRLRDLWTRVCSRTTHNRHFPQQSENSGD